RLSAHDTRAFADPAGTPRASQSTSGLSRILVVFGRVPLFYYLLHIYVIHVIAIVAASAFHQPLCHCTVIETTPNALYGIVISCLSCTRCGFWLAQFSTYLAAGLWNCGAGLAIGHGSATCDRYRLSGSVG